MSVRTEVITFRGVVQGVGFRPTVYRIAQGLGMKGRVRNMGGIVQVVCTAPAEEIDVFVQEIITRKPPMSHISGVERKVINTTVFQDFSIGQSSYEEDEIAIIPADIAICEDCLREFYDPDDPRYQHPFISCTNCGPRFSIIERLPYDRDTTTMVDFPMCEFCEGEYNDPASRRYHAQTISCHNCGPQPLFNLTSGPTGDGSCMQEPSPVGPSPWLAPATDLLVSGKVIAVKGVGGYYLVCTPFDEAAVQKLREIKHREQKPFAVMFRDIDQIKEYCVVGPKEEAALLSPQRPIMLLEQRPDRASQGDGSCKTEGPSPYVQEPSPGFAPGVCNTSRFVGAFLPSFGLQYLLLDALGPLIMTSANITEMPLITDDEAIEKEEFQVDGILYNNRRIASGLDDSVARIVDGETQLIRRSKGYIPAPVFAQAADFLTKNTHIFAAGGHLKSALAVSKGAYSYLSRHIGDIESVEAENVYAETYDRMKTLFEIKPALAVCDIHPRYFPTRFAEGLGLPVLRVQHHHAHIASVMAEHGLKGPVIGVSFDGTGYGVDGAIWGGEILICEKTSFSRFSHLKYVDMIGGDASMKDAWKSALSHLFARENTKRTVPDVLSEEFSVDLEPLAAYSERNGTIAEDRTVAAALKKGVNTVKTSSMGRLFDAACAMLGIHYENRYEGECAILLENAARRAIIKQKFRETPTEQESLALGFHMEIAGKIIEQCRRARDEMGVQKVCLSGGVFQNKILMEETLRRLRGECFTVYYNIHVPPNDGGIALGQNYIGMLQ